MRFNSKTSFSGDTRLRKFAFSWTGEFSWLVPPVYLIVTTVKHSCSSKAGSKAILVCPYWTSATSQDPRRYIKLGDYKESYVGSEIFKGSFIVFYMKK